MFLSCQVVVLYRTSLPQGNNAHGSLIWKACSIKSQFSDNLKLQSKLLMTNLLWPIAVGYSHSLHELCIWHFYKWYTFHTFFTDSSKRCQNNIWQHLQIASTLYYYLAHFMFSNLLPVFTLFFNGSSIFWSVLQVFKTFCLQTPSQSILWNVKIWLLTFPHLLRLEKHTWVFDHHQSPLPPNESFVLLWKWENDRKMDDPYKKR